MHGRRNDKLTRRFKRHQHLAREGDVQRFLYRIVEGWGCRYRLLSDGRRQITALFLPGDLCEPQWLLGGRASGPIVALTDMQIESMLIEDIGRGVGNLRSRKAILEAVLQNLNRQTEWIVRLGRKTATERVGELICEIFERMRAGQRVFNDSCAMPLTQCDLADIVGLTPVHVNRVLQQLRGQGLIELEAKWLRVPDPQNLFRLTSPASRPLTCPA